MGISLDSLSITSAFNSILSFFKSQENNSKWKDTTTGAEGTFLIRMLANILSNISYRLVTARRENYLSTANLLSSNLGIALNLGYSAHRGTNQKRKIKFEPNSDYIIPPFTVIGTYNDEYDVIYIGEKDAETHLRAGLVLEGPYNLGMVNSMSALTRTININGDVSNDIAVGNTISITGSVPEEGIDGSDGRYTVMAVSTIDRGNSVDTILRVEEEIPHNCVANQNTIATRIGIQEFSTVIGKLKTISWTANTSKTKPFTRFEEGISEDYILYLDGTEVPTSSTIRDLNNDTYLIRTNPYSSVDILYLNHISTNTHNYGSESTFTLKYVELADVETQDYSPSMSGYGTLINTLNIGLYTPFEEVNDIKINAPLDHEVQHLIRSKNDFTQRVKQSIPNILETAYKSITPTYTLLTYLKDDSTTIQQEDIDGLQKVLDKEKYFGTPSPDLHHPVREAINLVIQIFVTDKLKDSNDIRYDISNIIKSNYSKNLAQKFDTYALERLIEQLSYIKWARVSYDVGEWISRGTADLGSIIYANGTYYKASKILGTSGGSHPAWNIPIDITPRNIDLDEVYETVDGNVIWRAYKRLDVENIAPHEIGKKYAIGDYCYDSTYPNFMFKVVDLVKTSGATTTIDVSTLEVGDFIADGELIWVCKEYSSSYSNRLGSTSYRLGDSVNVGSKSLELVSYIGKTGYVDPEFEKSYYNVDNWLTSDVVLDFTLGDTSYFQVAGDQRPYYEKGSDVIAETDRGETQTFTVRSVQRDEEKDRTNVYVDGGIDTPSVALYSTPQSTATYSIFQVLGDQTRVFRIGDYIKGIGYMTDPSAVNPFGTVTQHLNTSTLFNIIDIKKVPHEDTYITQIFVKGALASNINYQTLVAAGYTTIKSKYTNSFILQGNMTSFFPKGSLIKVRTDENTSMTYVVSRSVYQGTFEQTYIIVNQEISNNSVYNRIAPSWSGTEDGEILWEIVDDINNIQYDWNVYNDISYKSILSH